MTPTTTTLTLHRIPLVVDYDAELFDGEMSVYVTKASLEGCEEHDISILFAGQVMSKLNGLCLRDAKRRRAEGLAHAAEDEAIDRYERKRA